MTKRQMQGSKVRWQKDPKRDGYRASGVEVPAPVVKTEAIDRAIRRALREG